MFSLARTLLSSVQRELRLAAGPRGRLFSSEVAREVSRSEDLASPDDDGEAAVAAAASQNPAIDEAAIRLKFQPQPVEYTLDDFQHLVKSDADRKCLHIILLELEDLRDRSDRAPCKLSDRDMTVLLSLKSRSKRQKQFE